MHAQPILYSAINPEIPVPNGPYGSVENTGADLAPYNPAPTGVIMAMCWDGTNPGIAIYDGNVAVTTNLPGNAHDPDVVVTVYDDIAVSMVVYELNGNVEYDIHRTILPIVNPPSSLTKGTVNTNVEHPNIDLNRENYFAVVYCDPFSTGNLPDIKYETGFLNINGPTFNPIKSGRGDNKIVKINQPQQLGECYWPDIAISGVGNNYGVHVTFMEDDGTNVWWWKMNDGFSAPPNDMNWYNTLYNTSTTASYLTEPRIACSKYTFNIDAFEAVLTDVNPGNTTHVMGVYNTGGQNVMVDWPMFMNGACNNAVTAWIDDPYINVAWSGIEPGVTIDYDIIVKRLDQNGQPYDNTWATANIATPGNQILPAITGERAYSTFPDQFGYFWVDDANALWFKIVPAANVQLKRNLSVPVAEQSCEVFPNPANNAIGVINKNLEEPVKYNLFDVGGILLAKGIIRHQLHYIMVNNLPNGQYLLKLDRGETIETFKIIIKH